MIAVCLRQVRLDVRYAAAMRCAKVEAEAVERARLLDAALRPSGRFYYLSDAARLTLERVAA